jgi:hypothetical protein
MDKVEDGCLIDDIPPPAMTIIRPPIMAMTNWGAKHR